MSAAALLAKDIIISGPMGPLVHVVGFRLEHSKCLGVIGESGSGKTLLLRSLLDLLPDGVKQSSGTIWKSNGAGTDEEVFEPAGWRGWGAAMVFQDPLAALDPSMTAGRFISEVLALREIPRGDRRKTVYALLNEVGFTEPDRIAHSYPHQLSNGQRQRVVLAIALASMPDVLLCDEATSALDTTTQAQIIDLLISLQSTRGLSIVFVTHDLAVANQICDDIVVLLDGRVMEVGSVNEVLKTPRHPYTQSLLSAYRSGDELSSSDDFDYSNVRALSTERGCPFRTRCPKSDVECDGEMPWVNAGVVRSGSSCVHDKRPIHRWELA